MAAKRYTRAGRGCLGNTGGQDGTGICHGYAGVEIHPGNPSGRRARRRGESGLLPAGDAVCAAEIPEAVSFGLFK